MSIHSDAQRYLLANSVGVLLIDEVHLPEDGCRKGVGYSFYWRGKPGEERLEPGVGFAIKSGLADRLEEIPRCVSDRIIVFRLLLRNG